MPILDIQQRLQEVGRIRMGHQLTTKEGKPYPARLKHWRLTSRDEQRLVAVAALYGGELQPWAEREGEYEVYTTSDQLHVLLIPGQALTQWWELWKGGGCLRRCDGHHEYLSDGDCLCPEAYDERADEAAEGKACKPTTRLAVLLPEVAGIGCWRLETKSYYAAVELAAATGLLEEATRKGALLPARLRIDVRKKVAGGKTTVYPVPVVDLDVTAGQLIALGQGAVEGEVLALPAGEVAELGYTPVPAAAQKNTTVAEGVDAAQQPAQPAVPRANAAASLGESTPPPQADPLPDPATDPEGQPSAREGVSHGASGAATPTTHDVAQAALGANVPMANHRQRRLLWATVRDRGVSEDQVRDILREVTGQESSAQIPAKLFDAVLTSVQAVPVAS